MSSLAILAEAMLEIVFLEELNELDYSLRKIWCATIITKLIVSVYNIELM